MQTYDRPTPETDAFMLQIDDSEIDLSQVAAKLKALECERDYARELLKSKAVDQQQACSLSAVEAWLANAEYWTAAADKVADSLLAKYGLAEEMRSTVWNAAWEGIREAWAVMEGCCESKANNPEQKQH